MGKIQDALDKLHSQRDAALEKKRAEVESGIAAGPTISKISSRRDANFRLGKGKALKINRQAVRDAGLLAPEEDEHRLVGQFRDIKRPLIGHAFGKRATHIQDGNLIMVSSAISGEGKSFTSVNLALSIAQERDHSVILVDADVAKPHTTDVFGATGEPGLLDLLEDESVNPELYLMPTDVPGLSILPAGKPRLHATELLASARMDEVAKALGSMANGCIVIFDSPPLLQTSEAKVLGEIVGQVVMVVRAEKTRQDAVISAIAALPADKAINLVLNQARSDQELDHHYQYGYGFKGRQNDDSLQEAAPGREQSADVWGQ